MAPTILQADYHYPSPHQLLSRSMTVATYFQKIRNMAIANNNGRPIVNAHWAGILMGIFSDYPTLQNLLLRLPPADIANIGTLENAVRRELFPDGEHGTHQQLLRDYWQCNQKVMEYPRGSGIYYPEPVITYIEEQRRLLEQLPVNARPAGDLQVRRLLDGLHPTLRNAMASLDLPANLDAAITNIMRIEQNLSAPMAPTSNTHQNVAAHTTIGTTVSSSPPDLPPMLGPIHPAMHATPPVLPTYAANASAAPPAAGPIGPTIHVDPAMRADMENLRTSLAHLKDSMLEEQGAILAEINTVATSLGKHPRSGSDRSKGNGNDHYGPASGRLYCSDCDMTGHSLANCWGECDYCGKRGHRVQECHRRLKNK